MAEEVRLQLVERQLTVDGSVVRLRAKSFDVLALLASRPRHLFTREELIDRVWRGRAVSPDVLTGCIREIRRALGDTRRSPRWIETVSGSGYRLLQAITTISASAPKQNGHTVEDIEPTVPDGVASVATLPFTTLDPDLASVGQALSRDINVGLARTRWLWVAASASAEQLDSGMRQRDAAEMLGVRYLLAGDLRRLQDRIVLQVTLADTRTERTIWADRIERSDAELPSMMEDVCAVVVANVESEIEAAERHHAQLAPVRGINAWVGFHRGMSLLQRQDQTCLEAADQALRNAARADPTCARIPAARSWHSWQQLFFGVPHAREQLLSQTRDLAQESIGLDPKDPLGHWALGRADWHSGDLVSAAESLQRSVELNPSFAAGHYALGYTAYLLGDEHQAIQSCDNAIALSPLDPLAFAFHCIKAHVLCFQGQTDQAAYHARCVASHPNVHGFALVVATWVQELCGNHSAAQNCLARIRHRWPTYSRSQYISALLHQSPWYPVERRRDIERAFDQLGFF